MLEILSEMEIEGITVSKSKMSKLSKKLAKQLVDLKSEAFLLSKKEFNLKPSSWELALRDCLEKIG